MQMEIDDLVRRSDGSVMAGLTRSEWEECKKSYEDVLEEELVGIIDTKVGTCFDKLTFEAYAQLLNAEKKKEKKYGISASFATSLFMLLSVHVKPNSLHVNKRPKKSSLSVCGEISSASDRFPYKKEYIYNRKLEDVQIFGSDGGYLTLNGPSESCRPLEACFLFQNRQLFIDLCDQQGQQLFKVDGDADADPVLLEDSEDDFEHVKEMVVQNDEISLTFKYVSIPMAVYGRLDFKIFNKEDDENLPKSLNVCGKVVAEYKNTFGNYNSEKFVLFDKNPDLNQCETLDVIQGTNLLSRCWVVAPAYSLLLLHIDLVDSQKKPILTQVIELATHNSHRASKDSISGKYLISVGASWFFPYSQPPAMDGSYNQFSWNFGWSPPTPPSSQPSSSSAIEVFSILVCSEECKPLQIHGRLQSAFIWTKDFSEAGIDIFKREEGNPLTLSGRGDTIPVVNGSRVIEEFISLSMICDLKDALGGLSIKGYEGFNVEDHHCERQSCSIFRGDHGFAALHYTIFSSAVQADLRVFVYQHKEGSQSAVSGSICAQYKYFDYSSQYKKNCYRIVLFKSSRGDLVPIDADGAILLSRSSFVVPTYSSSVFDLDFMIGTQKFSGEIDVAIGTPTVSIKEEECEVKFVLEWSEVK